MVPGSPPGIVGAVRSQSPGPSFASALNALRQGRWWVGLFWEILLFLKQGKSQISVPSANIKTAARVTSQSWSPCGPK